MKHYILLSMLYNKGNRTLFTVYNQRISMKGGETMKSEINRNDAGNPLSDLISDEIYELLNSRGLINEKSVRDHIIRRKFKNMRDEKVGASEAIEQLRREYPYLQFDTIRKIVYHIQK